jgi:hypothetical protein
MKDKKIKNKHVLVAGAGSNLKKYWGKIQKFLYEEDAITIGCNFICDVFVPDYHFWGTNKRWNKYGKSINKGPVLIFPPGQKDEIVRKYWDGSFETYDTSIRVHRSHRKHPNIYHCFENIALVSILYAYEKGASKISIAGMDGYSFHSKEKLMKMNESQHCYSSGFSDMEDKPKYVGKNQIDINYARGRKKDIFNYKNLKKLVAYGKKKYGFRPEIITPTVYKSFYNPLILDIKEKYNGRSPSPREKRELYKILGI